MYLLYSIHLTCTRSVPYIKGVHAAIDCFENYKSVTNNVVFHKYKISQKKLLHSATYLHVAIGDHDTL